MGTAGRIRTYAVASMLIGSALTTAHAASTTDHVWIISRVDGAARRLVAQIDVTSYSDRGALMVEPVTGKGRTRHVDFSVPAGFYGEVGTDGYVHAYYNGAVAECPAEPACTTPVGVTDSPSIDTTKPVTADFVVGAIALDIKIRITSPGWKVRSSTTAHMRVVRSEGAQASGVRVSHTSVETFHHAALAGGAYGSAVFAALPCFEGRGTASFVGAGVKRQLVCNGGAGSTTIAATNVRTTWSLDAIGEDVVGIGTHASRIAVLDLPSDGR